MEKVNATLILYFEINDSEIYGGDGEGDLLKWPFNEGRTF